MKRVFLILSIVCATAFAVVAQNDFEGKCGALLKQYIHDNFTPQRYVSSMTGEGGAWSIFAQCDVTPDGLPRDRYSSNKYNFPHDKTTAPDGMVANSVVDVSWWGSYVPDVVEWDLYNLLPCNNEVPKYKNDYIPGTVTDVDYANDVWSVGWGQIDGDRIKMYSPPKGYEGDFARIIMYMATIYPADRWSGQGANFFADGDYPTLNGYSRQLLLQWHNLDPVSDLERTRNDVIASVQGNRNPFVDYPQLVDYIWGGKSAEPYQPSHEEVAKTPLKATYSMSNDAMIDLYSPYIPDDAKWTINGVSVEANSVETASLGVGIHELRYESATMKGKLKIMIVE